MREQLRVSLEKTCSSAWMKVMVVVLYVAVLVWYVISGLQLSVNSALYLSNTEEVLKVYEKEVIAEVSSNGNVYTQSANTYTDEDILGYTRVITGTDQYFIKETGTFVAPLTLADTWVMSIQFFMLSVFTCLLSLVLSKISKGKVKMWILLTIFTLVSLVVDTVVNVTYPYLFQLATQATYIAIKTIIFSLTLVKMMVVISIASGKKNL